MPDRPESLIKPESGPVLARNRANIFVEHPYDYEIPGLCLMGRMTIPGICGEDIVRRVVRRNADSLFGIFRKSSTTKREDRILLGFYANLLLNDEGLAALKAGTFDARNPPDELMVPLGERPAAIYSWAVMAPGLFDLTVKMLAFRMGDLYVDLPILTYAATDDGRKTVRRRGFVTDEASGLSSHDRSQDAKRSFVRKNRS
jgi:hypothetical protein